MMRIVEGPRSIKKKLSILHEKYTKNLYMKQYRKNILYYKQKIKLTIKKNKIINFE